MKRARLAPVIAAAVVVAAAVVPARAQQPAAAPERRAIDTLVYPKLRDIPPPPVVRDTLPNGMRLLLVEDHDLPVVAFAAVVRGGLLAEPAAKKGLTDLLGEVQRSGGTAASSGDAIDTLLDGLGAEIMSGVDEAYGFVGGKTLVENLDPVLAVFAQVLTAPVFAQDKVDLGKLHMRSAIARRNDDVFGIASRELRKLLYGPGSPYARQIEYADVDALTREDLLAFHRAYYRPDATILVAWGDLVPSEMKTRLTRAFGGWRNTGVAPGAARQLVAPQARTIAYIEKRDVEQTFIVAGQLGVRFDDPDYPAIKLMSDILGGGMTSRLSNRLRTEKGLAYVAGGGMNAAWDHPGATVFFVSTKPSTTGEALDAMLEEVGRIREAPVTDDELGRAKDMFLNGYAFENESALKMVGRFALYEFHGYPQDFNVRLRDAVEKVTKDDVLRVARKHLDLEALTILAVGRQELFDRPLSAFGKVTTIDIAIPEPKR